jgi:hypothetical protein
LPAKPWYPTAQAFVAFRAATSFSPPPLARVGEAVTDHPEPAVRTMVGWEMPAALVADPTAQN